MRYLLPIFFAVALFACGNPIKDESAAVEVESGAEVPAQSTSSAPAATPASDVASSVGSAETRPEQADIPESVKLEDDEILGFWVGYFENAGDASGKNIWADEGFYWNRANKINISIDAIRGDSVFGHSVVAGNDRPFAGVRQELYGKQRYRVSEPGDDRYDGVFEFTFEDGTLTGRWEAYRDIDIKERNYTLEPREFTYDPALQLKEVQAFVDWTDKKETKEIYEKDGEVYEWVYEHFASATNNIYQLNASNQRLTKEQVENLKKGDLTIIRNTIYARHGYSFKNRPLRVFFDAQPWYIPVHADIRADFTELEKENIQLLLKYEKNAAEYYDYFGRG